MATRTPYLQFGMAEMAKRLDPDGTTSAIAMVLTEDNEIIQDAIWQPSNDIWGHKTTRSIKLPTGTWRTLNSGVSVEAPKTEEVWERIGILESFCETDVEFIDNQTDPTMARMQEARMFIEGMGQNLAKTLIYGATAGSSTAQAAEQFQGLATRMPTVDSDGNVLNAGGTGGDTTSIYIVAWSPEKVFMIYPKNSAPNVGITHEDMGKAVVHDVTSAIANTSQFVAYRDHFIVRAGLVVRDPRCIARLANIEVTGSTNLFDEDDLITILNRMPMKGRNAHIYVNTDILTQMEIALKDKSNIYYTAGKGEGLAGEPMMFFRNNPIRLCDQIVNTETVIA